GDAGIETTTVSNGEYAVRQLPKFNPDLVLADLFMPVRSGYEVCDFVKTSPDFGHVAVLLLASKMEPFDEKEAQRVRADGRIEKPFADPQAVLATVQQHLEKVAGQKPAEPAEKSAPAVEEAPPEPEPEPELPQFPTAPLPVTFDQQDSDTPLGFSDMMEGEATVPTAIQPSPLAQSEPPKEEEEVVDLSDATILTTDDELKQSLREEQAAPAVEEVTEEVIEATHQVTEEPPTAEEPVSAAPEVAEGSEVEGPREVEKPELAPAWEMTGPQAGAPEIPPAGSGGWDSQWKGTDDAQEIVEEPEVVVEEAQEVVEEAAPAEEPAPAEPAAAEEPAAAGQPFSPDEFATAMSEALGQEAAMPLAPGESAPAAPEPPDVDEVVERVLKRLSPQVMETIAREIVRPLAEALLKEKRED
ncbi:MAG: PleD family two-component system response regulator, partial [Terriglobia bacterium]